MHVIFVAPHFPANQRRFVRGLKKAGAIVTGVGEAQADQLDSELRGLLDGWEQVPNVCDPGHLEAAVRRIQRRGPWVNYLEATVEAHMLAAAEVRAATGIPGLSTDVVLRCRDKFEMKKFLLDRGVPCAAQAAVTRGDDARAFARRNGYPFILKPRDGAGAHGTVKVNSPAELEGAIAERGLDQRPGHWSAEDFIAGHEGFYDTITVNGEVGFESISHYYPGVLESMRSRDVNPYLVVTNRLDSSGYQELRQFGRNIVKVMGIGTSATHMEWFFGPKGLTFSEIGARPPGVSVWDLYAAAGGFDIYEAWAKAVCHGTLPPALHQRQAAGLLALRPDRDGVISGYSGVDEVQRRHGPSILKAFLPPVGTRTQPVEAGYMANAWVQVVHPDFDVAKAILMDIGNTVKVHARPL
ncbi:MAG: ATPase [Deltaproteobacteria bacterium]|jgi:phosphoribosylaminoimidazole carboxylase (NCAIR synthetase)|nr:ATPase [Deltaproteobacteria bacterium]